MNGLTANRTAGGHYRKNVLTQEFKKAYHPDYHKTGVSSAMPKYDIHDAFRQNMEAVHSTGVDLPNKLLKKAKKNIGINVNPNRSLATARAKLPVYSPKSPTNFDTELRDYRSGLTK